MPDYVLNRTHTHRSTHGHIINFVKGQPVYVPPVCVKEVVMMGADPVEGDRPDVLDDLPEPEVVLDGAERKSSLFVAFEKLEGRNQRGDFTGQGRPHPKALRSICGFEVDTRERDEAWEEYLEKKAEAQ